MGFPGEEVWLQISLVLLTAALTFLIWHRMWNRADHDKRL